MLLTTFYDILGIARSATAAEIKAAYRKLAFQYHPDKNPNNPQAEENFKLVNDAYQILSDEAKKVYYDYLITLQTAYIIQQAYAPPTQPPPQYYSKPPENPKVIRKWHIKMGLGILLAIILGICFYYIMNFYAAKVSYENGLFYYKNGAYSQALVEFNYAVEQNPKHAEAHYKLGEIYMDFYQNYAEASKALSNYILYTEKPYSNVWVRRGFCYLKQYEYIAALKDFDKAIHLNANAGLGYFYRGVTRIEMLDISSERTCNDLRKAQSMQVYEADAYIKRYCK